MNFVVVSSVGIKRVDCTSLCFIVPGGSISCPHLPEDTLRDPYVCWVGMLQTYFLYFRKNFLVV